MGDWQPVGAQVSREAGDHVFVVLTRVERKNELLRASEA